MNLLCNVRSALTQYGAGTTVLCALSGGADSVCLLHILKRIAGETGIRVAAAHLNHRIRGDEADRDEVFCRDLCRRLDIPLTVGYADVPALANASGKSIEEAARDARYAFLTETARNSQAGDNPVVLVTAHHSSDNAETVLLNLARGTGLAGLAGIPSVYVRDGVPVLRPLLAVSKQAISEYLAAEGIDYILDSSNLDETYTRNYIRASVLPLFERINPKATDHIAASAMRLREDLDFIETAVSAAMEAVQTAADGVSVSACTVKALHPAIAKRVIASMHRMADASAPAAEAVHIEAVLAAAKGSDPSAEVSLPGGLTAWRSYDVLTIGKKAAPEAFYAELPSEGAVTIPGFTIECKKTDVIYNNLNTFTVDCSKIHGILSVRPRKRGDSIRPVGRGWTKTVKKAMIDLKIPRTMRDTLPVIDCGGAVCAVYGIGCDEAFAAKDGGDYLTITIIKNS